MNMFYSATCQSPVGTLFIVVDGDGGLQNLSFSSKKAGIASSVPATTECDHIKTGLAAYFSGKTAKFGINLRPRGTEFQKLIWKTLSSVPAGTTISYKELAARAGKPQAIRATANAVAANPIAIFIPCHRVLASDGTLGGYSAGKGDGGPKNRENLKIKSYLLDLEKQIEKSRKSDQKNKNVSSH
ncbi:MAG: methylated-DNA--[protein]-cysteine S-methyltransferase [Spirochaetales bacterium]|nr:methylated-DNA--[protein]-cysteine S-methyltransferase [Spirochaetales bacterium]